MNRNSRLSDKLTPTWRYALIGGLASIPFSLGLYWLSGMGSEFSGGMVFFGGVLAGYLAKRGSARASSAGIRAGMIGGLPSLVWGLTTLLGVPAGFVRIWSDPLLEAVFLLFVSVALLGASIVAGLLGGMIGGWLSKKVDRRGTPSAGI